MAASSSFWLPSCSRSWPSTPPSATPAKGLPEQAKLTSAALAGHMRPARSPRRARAGPSLLRPVVISRFVPLAAATLPQECRECAGAMSMDVSITWDVSQHSVAHHNCSVAGGPSTRNRKPSPLPTTRALRQGTAQRRENRRKNKLTPP